MFRSGTTLLARMLNAHPAIAVASDPYARLFKEFRNRVAEGERGAESIDRNAPLDDYYFCENKQSLMKKIQNTGLGLGSGNISLDELRKKIGTASEPYSPRIKPFLAKLEGNTYAELLESGLKIIQNAYGNENSEIIGFKEVWTDEFAGHLLRQFPNAKIIHIQRDPRAISASINATDTKYPWLFLARQWRKLATFAWLNTQPNSPNKKRSLLVRYEKLVENPREEAERICKFLEIDFNKNLIEPSTFVDGAGKPWRQNSIHFEGSQEFNTESIDKWREILTKDEAKFIESMCFTEMKVFDYFFDGLREKEMPEEVSFIPPEIPIDQLAGWIRPYCIVGKKALTMEARREHSRLNTLKNKELLSEDKKQKLCLDATFFDYGRCICRKQQARQRV